MTERIDLDGHGMSASLLDGVLQVKARNFAAKGALGAAERSIPVEEISAVEFTAPTMLKNGAVIVQSRVGKTIIHFLRKQAAAGQALYQALLESSGASPEAKVTAGFANEKWDAYDALAAERREALQSRLAQRAAEARAARERAQEELAAARAAAQAARAETQAAWSETRGAWRELKQAMAGAGGDARSSWRAVLHASSAGRVTELSALLDKAEAPEEFDVTVEIAAVEEQVGAGTGGPARTATDLAMFALQEAEAAAEIGDIAREEEMLLTARAVGRIRADRAERKEINAQIDRRIADGKLRRGAQMLGKIHGEGAIGRWARTNTLLPISSGEKWIEIWSDRVLTADAAYPISPETSAQVYMDGQEVVTQRPTLTRMALLSPLPGSALIPGMALQKQELRDRRNAEIQIRDVNWALRTALDPNTLSGPRQLAEQVNAIAGRTARQAPQTAQANDLLSQLERLAFLIDKGVISPEEAEGIKAAMLTAQG